ncbi:hypothetical protein AC578_2408 [Pseudocercospora eumusae]|uniref:Amino acid permease/ SLC12A domain-containing protein n=1 Tax=Pseudocercospora eumusae TaxID=321146 RepID=A0A139HX83_9PEZI|nr:hypothetical protein AC578_2408 [Pseudocercospora eumusae]
MDSEKRAEQLASQHYNKSIDLERSATNQDGVTAIVTSGVDDAGYHRRLSKRQIMMMTFVAGKVAIAAFFQWGTLFVTHCFFRAALRAQHIDYPYIGILIIVLILACEFYLSVAPFGGKGSVKTFFANYLGAPIVFFDLIVYKLWYKTKLVKPTEVDFSEAFAFDEHDRMSAELLAHDGEVKQKRWDLKQKALNLIFG